MQLSTVLEVVLALSFLFATLSLIASGANEMISAVLQLRAKTLEKGIANLLGGDPQKGREAARRLYAHPMINSLYRGERLPSYIPKQKFALALIDMDVRPAVGAAKDVMEAIPATIARLPDGTVKDSLDVLWRDASGDVGRFRRNVEGWFDDSMERVSGWYRRKTQIILFALGVALALGLNINAATVAEQLWSDAPLRAAVVREAELATPPAPGDDDQSVQESLEDVKAGLKAVDGLALPIGWGEDARPNSWYSGIPGWLFTAIAISMGAPFWFDLLGKVARLRSTGVRTQTAEPKSAETEPR